LALTDIGLRAVTKYLTGETFKLNDIMDLLRSVQGRPSELQRKLQNELQSVLGGWADQVGKLKGAFKQLLDDFASELAAKEGIAKDKIRFVIFVDDLDRCLPDTTIAILENIKNYLTVEKCIFILGLNAKVIYQGLRVKYEGLEIDGREYLEKILNYSFYVPEPKLELVAGFATSRLEYLVLDDEIRELHREKFTEFGQILNNCRFNNPRKIKRILNRYLLFISNYERGYFNHQGVNNGVVHLIIIAEYYPDIFQLFLREYHGGEGDKFLQRLADIQSDKFGLRQFEEDFGISITSRYLQLSQMGNLFDFTNLSSETFKLARDVFTIARVS
jgi:hypothetical protein